MRQTIRDGLASLLRRAPIPGKWRLTKLVVGEPMDSSLVIARIPRVGLMELDLSSYLEREIFVTGGHGDEALVGRQILDHLRERGSVFVDVGANVGYHALRAARHLHRLGGRVVAFEPIRANYDRLVKNLSLNGLNNVRVERLGLSDTGNIPYAAISETS